MLVAAIVLFNASFYQFYTFLILSRYACRYSDSFLGYQILIISTHKRFTFALSRLIFISLKLFWQEGWYNMVHKQISLSSVGCNFKTIVPRTLKFHTVLDLYKTERC